MCFFGAGLWGDLQWQSCRRGGGLLPPPRDNGPDTRGGGSTEGPASQKALPLLIKRPSFPVWKGLLFSTSPLLSLSWLNAGKSTSLPKPCREINACRRGRRGQCRKKATHYSVPLDRDLGKNITWDISPVQITELGQWWELCHWKWGRGLQTLMSMKTWQIILYSSMKRDTTDISHLWPCLQKVTHLNIRMITNQRLTDKTSLSCGRIKWIIIIIKVLSGVYQVRVTPLKNMFCL